MRRVVVMFLVTLLVVPFCLAGELVGVKMPDEVTVSGKTVKLNGMGVRKKLWVKVYVGGLYLETKSSNAAAIVDSDQAKRVVMHFLTDRATKEKMDDAWKEGFEANSPKQYGALKKRVETFIGFFGDMKDGDRIEINMVPGEPTVVLLNGKEKGTIEGDDFAKGLLRVWLGDSPPTEDLKEGMLGK